MVTQNDISQEVLLSVAAALLARYTSGVCRFGADELRAAPVDKLQVTEDGDGGLWVSLNKPMVTDSPIEV